MNSSNCTCRKVGKEVIVYSQAFKLPGGLGDEHGFIHREFQCSNEDACEHRYTPECAVAKLEQRAIRGGA